MTHHRPLFSFLVSCALLSCSSGKGPSDTASSGPGFVDSDGDGISDAIEGEGDTDGDGVPDALDTDSDGDCIPDALERGDLPDDRYPIDTDVDGTPDYLDLDSDDNGIPDRDEVGSCGDPDDGDGDGAADFQDTDDDGDGIFDVDEGESDPDGDGLPNRLDEDSDGDCIPDAVEAGDDDPATDARDSDADGTPDYLDLDADADGWLDADEVDSLCDAPADTDEDLLPDYVDDDIDGDGLSNADEDVWYTNPVIRDSDGDGYTDGLEVFAGSDPDELSDIPRGSVLSVGPRERKEQDATFVLDALKVDIFVLLDTAYSYSCYHPDIPRFIEELVNTLFATFDNLALGFGTYDDYAESSYTARNGHPFAIQHQISTNQDELRAAAESLTMSYGGDDKGSAFEALYQTMTGVGYDHVCDGVFEDPEDVAPFHAGSTDAFGGAADGSYDPTVEGTGDNVGVGFRNGTTKVILLGADNVIRDAERGHDVPEGSCFAPASFTTAMDAVNFGRAKVLGINVYEYWYYDDALQEQLVEIAEATSSYIDSDGDGDEDDPAVLYGSWNWPDVSEIVEALWDLADQGTVDLWLEMGEDENGWITGLEPADVVFTDLQQGDEIDFALEVTTAAPLTRDDQFYQATVNVMVAADDVLEEYPIYLMIRPEHRAAE